MGSSEIILFQVSWPLRLTRERIRQQLSVLYGDHPQKALSRDITTLAGCSVDELPAPDDADIATCERYCETFKLRLPRYDRMYGERITQLDA